MYQPKTFRRQGGDEFVVAAGGRVTVESGGEVAVKDGGDIAMPGMLRTLRTRVTTAQVNAGHTLLPALAGKKYRMVDCTLMAIGGNASGATTVDIIGTLSSARKLVAAAIAALTQGTVARAGATDVVVLADGASFTANDANTAITIGKTDSNLATATHIDVLLSYTIEE